MLFLGNFYGRFNFNVIKYTKCFGSRKVLRILLKYAKPRWSVVRWRPTRVLHCSHILHVSYTQGMTGGEGPLDRGLVLTTKTLFGSCVDMWYQTSWDATGSTSCFVYSPIKITYRPRLYFGLETLESPYFVYFYMWEVKTWYNPPQVAKEIKQPLPRPEPVSPLRVYYVFFVISSQKRATLFFAQFFCLTQENYLQQESKAGQLLGIVSYVPVNVRPKQELCSLLCSFIVLVFLSHKKHLHRYWNSVQLFQVLVFIPVMSSPKRSNRAWHRSTSLTFQDAETSLTGTWTENISGVLAFPKSLPGLKDNHAKFSANLCTHSREITQNVNFSENIIANVINQIFVFLFLLNLGSF